MSNYTRIVKTQVKFWKFSCVRFNFVKFDIHFLGLPWEIFFGVFTDDYSIFWWILCEMKWATFEPLLTATSPQRSPLYNGHLSITATLFCLGGQSTHLLLFKPLHDGHLSPTVNSLQRSPLYNCHLYSTVTSLQRSPLYNGHLSTTVTSLQRSPLYNGHPSTTVTSL